MSKIGTLTERKVMWVQNDNSSFGWVKKEREEELLIYIHQYSGAATSFLLRT